MGNPQPPKVVVIGGSIAGLSTGIALGCLGCHVDVYEQSPTILRGRGGGLVVQYEMLDWMTTHGIAALATLSIPGVERQFLDATNLPVTAGQLLGRERELAETLALFADDDAGQEATVTTGHGTTDWFQIGKGVRQGCILSLCLFNFSAESIMQNARLDE